MAEQAKSLKVFVSYSRADVSFADQLVLALEDKGFDPILDRHDISGAENWRERLGKLILSADAVAFVLTAKSAASEICAWEVDEAVRLGKRIIPITHESVTGVTPPKALSELNWIPFYADPAIPGSGFYYGVKRLAEALSVDLDWLRAQTRYSERAIEWAKQRAEDLLLRGEALKEAEAWLARSPAGSHPPDLVREYLAASGDAEQHRQVAAKAQLEEREQALKTAEIAVADSRKAQQALRRFSLWALIAGVLLLAIAIPGNYFAATRTLDANDRKAALFADAANGLSRQGDYTRALLMALAGDPPARVGLLEELMRPDGNVAVRNALVRAYASDRAITSMDVQDATGVAVLRDGKRFITIHTSGALNLWTAGDVLDPKPIAVPKPVAQVFPLPDGDRLLLVWQPSAGQPFGIWSLSQGKLLQEFGPTLPADPTVWPQMVALSADGDWLVAGDKGVGDGSVGYKSKVYLWSVETAKEIKSTSFDVESFDAIAVSKVSDVVALSSAERVMVWLPNEDKREKPVEGSFGSIGALALINDSTLLFGSETGNIGDVQANGKLKSVLQAFAENIEDPEPIARMRSSSDSRGVLIMSGRGRVSLLDLVTAKLTEPFGRRGDIIDAGFLLDAGMLVAVSADGVVMLASFGRSTPKESLQAVLGIKDTPAAPFDSLIRAGTVDGAVAAGDYAGSVWAWRGDMPAAVAFKLPAERAQSLSSGGFSLSPEQSLIAMPNGPRVDVWGADSATPRASFTPGDASDAVSEIRFVADGTALFYRLVSNKAGVRKVGSTGDIFPQRAFETLDIYPSPDGRRIAEVVHGVEVYIHDAGAEKRIELPGGRLGVNEVVFSPDGKIVALLTPDGGFELWHPGESRAFQLAIAHRGRIGSLAFSAGGDLFATTGDDLHIALWRFGERDPVQIFELPADAGAGQIRFSADGKRVVSVSTAGVRRFEINPIVFASVDEQVKLACARTAARGATGFANRDYAEYGFMQKVPPSPCVTLGVAKKP